MGVVVMVHLKYVDPTEEKMAYSISCFSEEKSFYDCLNREFLIEEPFYNLEYSFYTYLLTGDTDDWIGYVLLSNPDLVNSYFDFSCKEAMHLLIDFKNKFKNQKNYLLFEKLERLLTIEKNSTHVSLILEEVIESLNNLNVIDTNFKKKRLEIYQNNLQSFLNDFPKYFYLDVVISLPKEEEIYLMKENKNMNINLLAERKYYGFIQEVLSKVEREIEHNFKDTPILVMHNQNLILPINREITLQDVPIMKRLIK